MNDRDLLDELPDGLVVLVEPEQVPALMQWKMPPGGITFHKIQSARFKVQVQVDEVAPYPTDLMKVLEANSVKDITTMEDKRFLDFIATTFSGTST